MTDEWTRPAIGAAPSQDPPDITSCVVRTLVLYALAEFQLGHATSIRILASGHAFEVGDDGRGHAIERIVDGSPYLAFVYDHLQYPFASGVGAPVQLQGLGLSLLNRLCARLDVTVRKRTATLQMAFANGHLVRHERIDAGTDTTGTALAGRIDERLADRPVDEAALRQWLLAIAAAHPSLRLWFNGDALGAVPVP